MPATLEAAERRAKQLREHRLAFMLGAAFFFGSAVALGEYHRRTPFLCILAVLCMCAAYRLGNYATSLVEQAQQCAVDPRGQRYLDQCVEAPLWRVLLRG